MKLSTYLFFNGNCEEAFKHYEKVLGGKITAMMTHAGTPAEAETPSEWLNKILHACIEIEGQMLMASDAPPAHSGGPIQSAAVSVNVPTVEEAERIFNDLSDGATITMPIAETFFSPRFGMLTDRFGTHWMVGAEMPAEMADCGVKTSEMA
jgi:PhnB protein